MVCYYKSSGGHKVQQLVGQQAVVVVVVVVCHLNRLNNMLKFRSLCYYLFVVGCSLFS